MESWVSCWIICCFSTVAFSIGVIAVFRLHLSEYLDTISGSWCFFIVLWKPCYFWLEGSSSKSVKFDDDIIAVRICCKCMRPPKVSAWICARTGHFPFTGIATSWRGPKGRAAVSVLFGMTDTVWARPDGIDVFGHVGDASICLTNKGYNIINEPTDHHLCSKIYTKDL